MDGVYGSIVVRQAPSADPNSHLYDYDLTTHIMILSDWLHEDALERYPGRLAANTGQDPETVLINGKGQFTVISVEQSLFVCDDSSGYKECAKKCRVGRVIQISIKC